MLISLGLFHHYGEGAGMLLTAVEHVLVDLSAVSYKLEGHIKSQVEESHFYELRF